MTALRPAARATSVDRSTVPRWLVIALTAGLITIGAISVPLVGRFAPVPVGDLVDVWIILFVLAGALRGRIESTLLVGVVLAYSLTRLLPALVTETPLLDFLQAFKWLLYLLAFAIALGRHWSSMSALVRLTWITVSLALAKSALTFVAVGPGERPGLFTENNYEISLFAGLIIVVWPHLERRRMLLIFLFGVVTVLSGSRSGTFAFVIVAIYAMLNTRGIGLLARYLMVCVLPLLALIPYSIFVERSAGVAQVDRLRFFDVFLAETRNWDALTWLFGTVPLTPLDNASCAALIYYQRLFSSEGDGTCYSVILHAFNMRVIFDAGIVGLLLAYGVAWYVMTRTGVGLTAKAALIGIAIANGTSVSGLNNPYVALPILLVVLCSGHAVAERSTRFVSKRDAQRSRSRSYRSHAGMKG